jgi:predicted nucleic acid-binding protein
VCREHGIERILTDDGDFARFDFLDVVSLADPPPS